MACAIAGLKQLEHAFTTVLAQMYPRLRGDDFAVVADDQTSWLLI